MGLPPLEIYIFFLCGDRLYTSESDVCGRHILTYKDDPRTGRVKYSLEEEIGGERAHSCSHAVGFHYETYGEITSSRTLAPMMIRLNTAQFDFAFSDRSSYEKIHFIQAWCWS